MSDESQRISKLPRLSELNDDDYLVLQRGKRSYKIPFYKFKDEFIKQFNAQSGVKSAISCDASQFARFDHGHDYSDIFFFPTYGPQSQNIDPILRQPDVSCNYCGKFNITKYDPGINQSTFHEISVFSPPVVREIHNEVNVYDRYKVGDLQYLAVKDFSGYLTSYRGYTIRDFAGKQNIDVDSPSFDGFVIPNGTRFTCNPNDFQEACQTYAGDPNATSFTVPDIANTFFKCDPGLADMTPLSYVNYHNALPAHSHGGRTNTSSSLAASVTINFGTAQIRMSRTGTYVSPFVHWGKQNVTEKKCPIGVVGVNVNGSITNMSINLSGDNVESYPTHQYMQMLLYIGSK